MPPLVLTGATAQPQTLTQASTLPAQFGGVVPSIVEMFWSMQEGNLASGAPKFTPFPIATADSLYKKGQLYLHTWAPYDWKNAVAWTPDDICNGKYDSYLVAQARAIAKWGHPCWVRFCHEFNGSWSKWFWPPADFLRVWTYVVTLFRREGATNISWVWGPNQVDPVGSASSTAADKLAAYLPDPSLYDWASWDAYNWGDARGGSWQSFAQINDLTYQTLDGLVPADKPLMIAEYACNATPGDQAAWITDALTTAPQRYPRLRAMVYYPVQPASGTWPLSAAAGAAYASALKAGPYAVTGQYPMPPDSAPIKPFYSASWGDPAADLTAQLAAARATIAARDSQLALLDQANVTLSGQNTDLAAQLLTQSDALAATRTEVDRWRLAGSQVTGGLDNMRSILLP